MNRAVKWLHLGGRQRAYALRRALGCSATAVAIHTRKPILADSAYVEEDWRSRRSGSPHNRPLSDRVEQTPRRPKQTRGSNETEEITTKVSDSDVPPPQTHGHSVFDAEGDFPDGPLQAWQYATGRVSAVCGSFQGVDMTSIREKITGMLIPQWIRMLPGWLEKLQNELSMAPWSLSWEIWEEAHAEGIDVDGCCGLFRRFVDR